MPATPHTERHFGASEVVRDIVIGMSDGLTVPFALAAGLSSALSSTHLIITAGAAEIAAGALAMGLGGYLAARTDREHYGAELDRERRETEQVPEEERKEVAAIFREYGLDGAALSSVVDRLVSDRSRWVRFMMRFELGLEPPDPRRELRSAITIALAYVAGGIIPLWPYLAFSSAKRALTTSVLVTSGALFCFGAIKGRFTGVSWVRSGVETLVVGGLAASAAFALARLFS